MKREVNKMLHALCNEGEIINDFLYNHLVGLIGVLILDTI